MCNTMQVRVHTLNPYAALVEKFDVYITDNVPPGVAVMKGAGQNFTATFFDAGISSGGATRIDAFQNLVRHIALRFQNLVEHEKDLDADDRRQLAVLRVFIYDGT